MHTYSTTVYSAQWRECLVFLIVCECTEIEHDCINFFPLIMVQFSGINLLSIFSHSSLLFLNIFIGYSTYAHKKFIKTGRARTGLQDPCKAPLNHSWLYPSALTSQHIYKEPLQNVTRITNYVVKISTMTHLCLRARFTDLP